MICRFEAKVAKADMVIGLGNITDPKDYGSIDKEKSPSDHTVTRVEMDRECPDGLPEVLKDKDDQWFKKTDWMCIMTEKRFNRKYLNTDMVKWEPDDSRGFYNKKEDYGSGVPKATTSNEETTGKREIKGGVGVMPRLITLNLNCTEDAFGEYFKDEEGGVINVGDECQVVVNFFERNRDTQGRQCTGSQSFTLKMRTAENDDATSDATDGSNGSNQGSIAQAAGEENDGTSATTATDASNQRTIPTSVTQESPGRTTN